MAGWKGMSFPTGQKMSPSLPREGRGFFVPGWRAAFTEQRGKAHAGVGDGTAADGQVWSPLFTAGKEKGNSFFPKRWDSGVGRIFWGSGRWESGLMGKPLYGSREGKRAGGARQGWNSRRWAGVVSPVLRRGEKRGTASFQKGAGENVLAGGEKME